ncbi:hypothetical protein ACHAQJ_003090 [Trichoderma viride]
MDHHPKTDSNGRLRWLVFSSWGQTRLLLKEEAGILPGRYEACLPCGQSVGNASDISNGDEDAATSNPFVIEPFYHDEVHQEQQLVLYNPVDENLLNQPYLPWDLPDFDQVSYPYPLQVMANDQYFPSLSHYEELNYFNRSYLQQEDQQDQHQLEPSILPSVEGSEALELQDGQGQADEFGQLPFGNSDNYYEPPSFDFNTVPNHQFQQPPLDQAWATIHNGGLFEGSQTPEVAIKGEAPLVENNGENWPAPITQLHVTEIAPIQQQVEYLVRHELPVNSPPQFRQILPSGGILLPRTAHRRPVTRRKRTPKPPAHISPLPLEVTDRETKDRFLVEAKLSGVSYKDIKRLGNFTEAESTLRGRFRTLTKKKEHRVRDPQWTAIDIHLLKEAVQVLGQGLHPDDAKISWMAVSTYINDHGGTYKFGYSTCHRRWVYLEATGQLGMNWVDESWEGYHDDEEEYGDEDASGASGEEDEGEYDDEMEGVEDGNESEIEDDVALASED